MTRSAAVRIGTELIPVLLVLTCLGGSLALIVTVHRRFAVSNSVKPKPVVVAASPAPPPPAKVETPDVSPPRPPEDPTPRIVAKYAALIAAQRAAAEQSDRLARSRGEAAQAAEAEAKRWRDRGMLVRAQADRLNIQASRLEAEADELALERDILARKRDEQRASLAKARSRDAYAVLPYKGPNGTWRRPIAIECRNGEATIQPGGPTFSLLELSMSRGLQTHPLALAIAQVLLRARLDTTPDGDASVPYILFIIRPDGIRAYYEARAKLEPLGIAFGYELVEQTQEIDYPDLDDPSQWTGDGPSPRQSPPRASGTQGLAAARSGRDRGSDDPFIWPVTPSRIADRSGGAPSPFPSGSGSGSRGTGFAPSDGPPIRYVPDPRRSQGAREGDLVDGRSGSDTGSGADRLEGLDRVFSEMASPSTSRRSNHAGSTLGEVANGTAVPGSRRNEVSPSLRALAGDAYTPRSSGGVNATPPGAGRSEVGSGRPTGRWIVGGPRAGGSATEPTGRGTGGGDSGSNSSHGLDTATTGPEAPHRPVILQGANRSSVSPASDPSTGPSGNLPLDLRPEGVASTTGTEGAGDGDPRGTPPDVTSGGSPDLAATNPPGAGASLHPSGGMGANGLRQGSASDPTNAGGTGLTQSASGNSRLDSSSASPSARQGGIPATASSAQLGTIANRLINASGMSPGQGFGLGSPSSASGAPPNTSSVPFDSLMLSDTVVAESPEKERLDLVIACSAEGVTIQPGGYRLSHKALEEGQLLLGRLKSIAESEGGPKRQPILHFVVEPGGQKTFWLARKQTTFTGLDWPATLRLAEGDGLRSFSRETR